MPKKVQDNVQETQEDAVDVTAVYLPLLDAVLEANDYDAEARVAEARETLAGLDDDKRAMLDALIACGNPRGMKQSVYAATLAIDGKYFRGNVRKHRLVGVSKSAAGCKRDVMDVTDLIWAADRFTPTS